MKTQDLNKIFILLLLHIMYSCIGNTVKFVLIDNFI